MSEGWPSLCRARDAGAGDRVSGTSAWAGHPRPQVGREGSFPTDHSSRHRCPQGGSSQECLTPGPAAVQGLQGRPQPSDLRKGAVKGGRRPYRPTKRAEATGSLGVKGDGTRGCY